MPTSAALVPFTITDQLKQFLNELSGTSQDVSVTCNRQSFSWKHAFTHRGLSGPGNLANFRLQIQGDTIGNQFGHSETFWAFAENSSNKSLEQILNQLFSKSSTILLQLFFNKSRSEKFCEISKQKTKSTNKFIIGKSNLMGTEGYQTAEVTKGGVNTDEVSSKNFWKQTRQRFILCWWSSGCHRTFRRIQLQFWSSGKGMLAVSL